MEALEVFYPDRMARRILGMGDVLTLVEKAEESIKQEEAEYQMQRLMSAKFDFTDFLAQVGRRRHRYTYNHIYIQPYNHINIQPYNHT